MTTDIYYTVEVEGEQKSDTFTPEDVNDKRAGWNPDVAESYAQHFAVEAFGTAIDVNTVDVRLRDTDTYDETGGTPAGGF